MSTTGLAFDNDSSTQPDFNPEQVNFGSFTFVSWVRTGAATSIASTTPTANGRASLLATVQVVGTPQGGGAATTLKVTQNVALHGPGDVVGIQAAQVVRCYPPAGSTVPADGSMALIEFDAPELPWLHTPLGPDGQNKLRPWLMLVVVDSTQITVIPGTGGFPASIAVDPALLPSAADAWAFAHAQVIGVQADPSGTVTTRLSDNYGPQNLSRILCPQQLKPQTSYVACLVPVFATGRQAGLQLPAGADLGVAWSGGGQVQLPVYFSWSFSTGVACDFETLARDLTPKVAPPNTGRRVIDTSSPRGPLADMSATEIGPGGGLQTLDCALVSPQPSTLPHGTWSPARTTQLHDAVNKGLASADSILPLVEPRAYAQYQRGANSVPAQQTNDWFADVNLNPLHRLVAGLGTRTVRRDQEALMQAAWLQVGEAQAANDFMQNAQIGSMAAAAINKSGAGRMALGSLMQLMCPLMARIHWGENNTLNNEVSQSALPMSSLTTAYRKALAPYSQMSRAAVLNGAATAPFSKAIAKNNQTNSMQATYRQPDGIAGIASITDKQLTTIGLQPGSGASLRSFKTAYANIQKGAPPKTGAAAIDLQTRLSSLRVAKINGALSMDSHAMSPGLRESLGIAVAGVVNAAPAALQTTMMNRLEEFDGLNPLPAAPIQPLIGGVKPVIMHVAEQPAPAVQQQVHTTQAIGRIGATPIDLNLQSAANAGIGRGIQINPNIFKTLPVVAGTPATRAMERFGHGTAVASSAPKGVTAATIAAALTKAFNASPGKLSFNPARKVSTSITRETVLAATDPVKMAAKYVASRVKLAGGLSLGNIPGIFPPLTFAPSFDRPMHKALLDYDSEWLVPGLGQVGDNNFVTLLVANPSFVESYMIGLSDEMARELLWRDFPADLRATYFHRFWNAGTDDMPKEIRTWGATPLGSHTVGGKPIVVLLVRGELVKNFPNLIPVAATKNGNADDFTGPGADGVGRVLFRSLLSPDTMVTGFNLTVNDIQTAAAKWYFLLCEHPGAPRFGMDPAGANAGQPTKADDLDWSDLTMGSGGAISAAPKNFAGWNDSPKWGDSAAGNAAILLQHPARAAFDADSLLGSMK